MLSAKILQSSGFHRKQCPLCKSYFWTRRADQIYCGDQPCVPYGFIGNPPARASVESLADLRERFLRFFERNSHVRIRRYPVVARWRDDVYLVGASIYDFQPWVTSGAVPPPANPLAISQPSIRLTDVDKVGRSGRHLTGFEMMAHHAFNYPDKYVYWIDETTQYAYEFFTRELGIPPDEITFKESMWEGGGNAGECFEVLIRGLEVATLVFMHYEVKDGRYVELPLKIVDTGYGLERIYWLLKGTPTVYDAVFGPYLAKARQRLGVPEPPAEVMGKASVYFGQMDPEVIGLEKAYDIIAEKIGVDPKWLREVVRPQEALYVLADHSRTVSWMIADGVIPSNTGAGYLARLLIRRILKNLRLAGVDAPLVELFDMHLAELKREYPEVWEARGLILELVDMEERRYREVLKSAPAAVKKALEEARRRGRAGLDADDLVALYDSQGIPPEVAAEVAKSLGTEVKVPDDFYAKLAARHVKREKKPESSPVEMGKVADLPRTRELFYEDSYMRSFKARVLRVIDGRYVVLDQTAFYPEGGGQPADRGVLKFQGGEAKVVDVQRVGHVVVHVVEGQPPPEGAEVVGEVDWERRYSLMKMHTGTHVLIQSIRRVLGSHIWQAGAQKDIPSSRIDVTHHRLPTAEEVARIEELANRAVQADLPVYAKIMPRNEAEAKYGFVLYQGGVVPAREIRVLQIGPDEQPYDVQACGGTHLRSTGEIGLIKIQKVERIADGVVRFVFTTGMHALAYVQELERRAAEAASIAGGSRDELVEAVRRLAQRAEEADRRARRYAELYAAALAENLKAEQVGRHRLAVVELDDEELARKIALAATSRDRDLVLVFVGGGRATVYTGGVDVAPIVKALREVGFRGGGSKTFAQGQYKGDIQTLKEAIRRALA
ncbi:alanine--tRNA ligase [Pyrobaculum neutrophilum]|uniref:Alanine--tRNA ligase n=1 Tax=Pyrobaculum neutrophilum (strain DSM 2338 / JCM 9278 / NBRC 100436 / V24Sta) TaxID=444157 RepID=SYA_PYRNV|nr:alanine--tRNA ligase [Pyrobaculum neutrophilum]B1YDH4.1 RecName: Full=Alanine--tRNA ligase; AltName: Full=Alanyl-tRNA synthetase; Short=AlaRS [Pyrobaculum neutrophilum V24Sta]ACB39837.1 alanyl-tRNA synthetase [Pyrobaculum neutrophilum V24Sta]